MRLGKWLSEAGDDVRYALRQLRGAPGFAFVAVITLALGIGVNGAIFALVDAVLLRPLPVSAPDRLVRIGERTPTSPLEPASPLNLLDWNERARSFDGMAGFIGGVGRMLMANPGGSSEMIGRQWVTPSLFAVLGVQPVAGRTFLQSDRNAVVLSDAFWESRFRRDPAIIGQALRLDGTPYTVVGVVPSSFRLMGRSDLWASIPLVRRPQLRTAYFLFAIARLKSGVSIEGARADLTGVAEALARELPATNAHRGVTVEPLHDALVGREARLSALLFVGVVGVVLLICCANVANLLLARATVRSRELAIRSALGAPRGRVLRQMATESLVLAAIGGTLGMMVGATILSLAPTVVPPDLLPPAVTLTFDARVVGFCAAAAVGVGGLFGLAPAWQATGISLASVTSTSGRTTTARGSALRAVVVAGEVATAVLLLFGAGLLLRTLLALDAVDRGYRADRVLTMMVDPLGSQYPTQASLQAFFARVEREIASIATVRSVAWVSTLPMGTSEVGRVPFVIVGDPPVERRLRPTADYQIVSARYFDALDLPILAGRAFTERDRADSVPVCIVNEAFVRTYAGGRSPLGLRVEVESTRSNGRPVVREVVGVARQVKGTPDEVQDLIQVYVPIEQDVVDDMYLVARPVSGPAEALTGAIRGAIARVDTQQLVSVDEIVTLDDIAHIATARHRFRAVMVMTLAGLSLVLAMIGVFGVLAYSVQQRLREFGVRLALGATRAQIARLVAASAARLLVSGTAVGLVLAAMLARVLTTMLFGVQPLDPTTFLAVVALLMCAAAACTVAPVWRAMRADPASVLRGDQ